MRRRLMLRSDTDSIDIPIGVNLISEKLSGFWINTTVGTNNYSYYDEGGYLRFIVPFDSGCTFSMSNILNVGNTRSYLVDQNGIVRWVGTVVDPTELKTIATQLETDSIKITQLFANTRTQYASMVSWIRTS